MTMPTVATKPTAKDAYKLFKSGKSFREIADQLGIGTAQAILEVRTWEKQKKERQREQQLEYQRAKREEKLRKANTEKPVDTKLKSHQIVSILEESLVGQSPENIAVTLDLPVHDVTRIVNGLEDNADNLKRVLLEERYGKDVFGTISSELLSYTPRSELQKRFGLSESELNAIEQSGGKSTGPSEKEWQEYCTQYAKQRKKRNKREGLSNSIADWNFPRRCLTIMENAGVETVTRLLNIIDGSDSEFSNLEQIPDMDVDGRDRVMAIINDELDSVLPDEIPYYGPFPESRPKVIPNRLGLEPCEIRMRVTVSETLQAGLVVQANVIPSRQAIVELADGTSELLETSEFELVFASGDD